MGITQAVTADRSPASSERMRPCISAEASSSWSSSLLFWCWSSA